MKNRLSKSVMLLSAAWIVMAPAASCAQPAMVRGEDFVETPEMADGLHVHNFFQSNMVLQRGKPIRVWGWAPAGESVEVILAGNSQIAITTKEKKWEVVFPAMEGSHKPLELQVKGREKTRKFENILIGDLWLLGGQSNMEFPISKVENGSLEIVSANLPEIRLLTMPTKVSRQDKASFSSLYEWSDWSKRHFRKGYWDVCSPETVGEMSAIGYVFARRLHAAVQVPIGLIDASVGGTTLEAWTPLAVSESANTPAVNDMLDGWKQKVADWNPQQDLENQIKRYESKVKKIEAQGKDASGMKRPSEFRPGPGLDKNFPGNCFASLIAPLHGIEIKGAIFHQGFNNCFSGSKGARMYGDLFPKMIEAWRHNFNASEMPFGILSLCTAGTRQSRDNYLELMVDAGAYIRAAQYRTFLGLYQAGDKNVGFASTYDLSRRWYHPQLKIPAGERIARWALATQYGFDRELKWLPPVISEVKPQDGSLLLKFGGGVGGVDDGGPMHGFAIAGEDRHFQPAEISHFPTGKDGRGRVQYDRSVLVLKSPLVEKPVHYRYAWARNPLANIQAQGNSDIPLATQRSDDWELEQVPLESGADSKEMKRQFKADDLNRRLHEAKALIKENS